MRPMIAFVVLALLAGCGERKVEQTVFDPQTQALKKAREAETRVQEGARKTRDAADAGAPPSGY